MILNSFKNVIREHFQADLEVEGEGSRHRARLLSVHPHVCTSSLVNPCCRALLRHQLHLHPEVLLEPLPPQPACFPHFITYSTSALTLPVCHIPPLSTRQTGTRHLVLARLAAGNGDTERAPSSPDAGGERRKWPDTPTLGNCDAENKAGRDVRMEVLICRRDRSLQGEEMKRGSPRWRAQQRQQWGGGTGERGQTSRS